MSTKITFIGGGSYQWTPTLLLDIVQTPVLADAEIASVRHRSRAAAADA